MTPPRGNAIVDVRGLRKSFGATEVLKGIDLVVEPQELVFIIGPSGAGKSTFLRCLNRLEEPTDGSIVIDGVDLLHPKTDINAMRRRIGMVFQAFNLYPHMTALGNVTLALRKVLGKSTAEAEAIAVAALARVGLKEKAKSYPNELSGGQQQRVAIARAIALEPKIMLFDEPTSSLDPELAGSVLAVMRDLGASGMTMVVASHEIRFARDAAAPGRVHGGRADRRSGPAGEDFRPRRQPTGAGLRRRDHAVGSQGDGPRHTVRRDLLQGRADRPLPARYPQGHVGHGRGGGGRRGQRHRARARARRGAQLSPRSAQRAHRGVRRHACGRCPRSCWC